MDAQTQEVLEKLEALRVALNQAGAPSQQGWMRQLYDAAENAHTRAITEAAIAQQQAEG